MVHGHGVMDMRYALSWSRFILFMSVFALRFLAYRNLTYDGYGQFAWSESVWITFWLLAMNFLTVPQPWGYVDTTAVNVF